MVPTNQIDSVKLTVLQRFLETSHSYSFYEANLVIAQRCLGTYLWGECNEDDLLNYATQHWPSHVEHLNGSSQRSTIKNSVVKFLTEEEHFEDWLEHLDLRPITKDPCWSNSRERKLEACFSSPPSALFAVSCFGLIEYLESNEFIENLDVNQLNKYDTSGLYLAARWGHTELVRTLLRLGAAVDAPGHQYGKPLQAASFGGHEEIVRVLLEQGASFSATDNGEYSSPLHAALASDHGHVAETLIDCGLQLVTQKQFADALETASFKGNIPIVEGLLSGKVGLFTPNIRPDPLQVALFGGKTRKAARLLQDCVDITEEGGYFGNALAAAIASRKLAFVQSVIDAGAKLDVRGRFGFPLRAAVLANHLGIAKYLLEKGADPNINDNELGDPLQAAASSGNVDMMLLLLSHDASVDGFGGHFGNTLQAASFHGHEQAVRLLIEHGATLSHKHGNILGRYRDALQAAVYAGRENIVEMLLAAGAEIYPGRILRGYPCTINSRPKRIALPGPRTGAGQLDIPAELGPLEVAARRGNVTLVEKLLAHGATIDARDANLEDDEFHHGCAYTALQIAAFWGHLTVVNCLLDHGADINAVRQTLGVPLQAALEANHFDVAEVLLSRGADIDKHWAMFGSCLQVFSERGHIEAVKFLLDRGANLEDPGGKNGNALQVACNAGCIDIVQILLDRGADVRAPGGNLGNALQAASITKNLKIVELLLRQGIEVDSVDNVPETALCHAADNGDEQMVILLLQQGAKVEGNSTQSIDERHQKLEPMDTILQEKKDLVATPLLLAAMSGHESIISILLRNGANAHRQGQLRTRPSRSIDEPRLDGLSCTPLVAACYWGHASVARRLFRHDPWGYTSHDTFTFAVKTALGCKKKDVSGILLHEAICAKFKAEQLDGAFRYACAEGCTDFVENILKHYSLINWPKALLLAADRGRSILVEVLLCNGADMNVSDKYGNLALNLVIQNIKKHRNSCWTFNPPCWIEILGILLMAGADTTDLTGKIKTIYPDIARSGSIDVWTALDCRQIHALEDPALSSKALVWASGDGNIDKIHYLAAKHVPSTTTVKSAVLAAIRRGRDMIPTIEALLNINTLFSPNDNKEENDNSDNEPLVIASDEGYTEVVAMLLQHARHGTPVIEAALRVAIRCGHVPCAHLILDSQIWKPAERLVLCSRFIPHCFPICSKDMLTYMFDQGVSPNTRHPETGETLLYIAAIKGDDDGAKSLVSHGADVHLNGGYYGTALHGAAVSGSWGMVELLLLAGADVNAQSARAGTPLIAVMAQKWDFTCLKDMFEFSCLTSCHQCCARVLLGWDADVDAKAGELGTAPLAAEKVGNKFGIKMLLGDGEVGDSSSDCSD